MTTSGTLVIYEKEVAPPAVPEALAAMLGGFAFVELVRGYVAPAQVYRVSRPGSPNFYLKVGSDLRSERDRLSWLQGRFTAPRVEFYAEEGETGFLLLSELGGTPASDPEWSKKPESVIRAVAKTVRGIHEIAIDDCPFYCSVESLFSLASEAINSGRIKQSQLSSKYRHLTRAEILKMALELRLPTERMVVTHGDCCLPNILIDSNMATGVVDLGLAGISDPWRDLALVTRSIRRNLGEQWVREFFSAYGEEMDETRIEFFSLLDQLTMMRRVA